MCCWYGYRLIDCQNEMFFNERFCQIFSLSTNALLGRWHHTGMWIDLYITFDVYWIEKQWQNPVRNVYLWPYQKWQIRMFPVFSQYYNYPHNMLREKSFRYHFNFYFLLNILKCNSLLLYRNIWLLEKLYVKVFLDIYVLHPPLPPCQQKLFFYNMCVFILHVC